MLGMASDPNQNDYGASSIKVLKGLDNSVARFYVASLVLALDYLHQPQG